MGWDVRGKTVLVTGASAGIGLEAAAALAGSGARVVMVGRDPTRTEAAVAHVSERTGATGITPLLCDFSTQADIRRLADALLDRLKRIDVLVNNAGGVNKKRSVTGDGIETTFAVNHLGYFLLTSLLLERIVASAPARIVTVASIGHRRGTMDFEDIGLEHGYTLMRAYSRSKLANVLFAAELARRLDGTGVTSNSVHPGSVDTKIWSGAPLWAKPLIRLFFRPFFISVQEGAACVVDLVTRPELQSVTGAYFELHERCDPSRLARDEALAKRLWDVSASLVGLPTPQLPVG